MQEGGREFPYFTDTLVQPPYFIDIYIQPPYFTDTFLETLSILQLSLLRMILHTLVLRTSLAADQIKRKSPCIRLI